MWQGDQFFRHQVMSDSLAGIDRVDGSLHPTSSGNRCPQFSKSLHDNEIHQKAFD